MNNDQFRRLVLDKPEQKRANDNIVNNRNDAASQSSSTPSSGGVLGSRLRASIPMTPRSVRGGSNKANVNADFARQLAEQRREEMGEAPPSKRFKSSAAPKGTKLATGYQDRTALRRLQETRENQEGERVGRDTHGAKDEGGAVDIETRLKALEEMVKLGQIDHATFEKLRREIGVGGDLGSTHLVKGLDWDLLKKVRAGKDLEKTNTEEKEEKDEGKDIFDDVDEELDLALKQNDGQMPAPKEKKVKKGNLAMPPPSLSSIQGSKMSRDEILRRLKAARSVTAQLPEPAPPESTLGTKFKKIKDDNQPEKKRWTETDPSGRRKEILVITDAEGKTKRKVRWLDKEAPPIAGKVDSNGLLLPSQDAKPLGMEVPAVVAARIAAEAAAAAAAEAEDDDIFAGVGTDYNPLADLDEDDSDDESKEEKVLENKPTKDGSRADSTIETASQQQTTPRNYFGDRKLDEDIEIRSNPLTSDPTILAALNRAATLRQSSASGEHVEKLDDADEDIDPETLARRKKFFEEARRRDALDAQDLDYGFGSSRIEDEEDEEGPTFDGQRGGGNKRRRGPKKRKGDKNSASDVLRVMEGQQKE